MSGSSPALLHRRMAASSPRIAFGRMADAVGGSSTIGVGASVFLATAFLFAVLLPNLFWIWLLAGATLALLALIVRLPVQACVSWLIIAASTPEYWLGDLLGGGDVEITGLVKLAGLALAAICVLRYGFRADPFNPATAFVLMFVAGTIHGLHPNLTLVDSARTLAGSAAPYAFAFARLPRRWADAVITTTCWLPMMLVAAGGAFALAGIRPMFQDYDGLRLATLGHPAFLAGFVLTAIYACLVELFRHGRLHHAGLLAANLVILVLTGARAPLVLAIAVCGISLLALPSRRLRLGRRLLLLAGSGAVASVLVAVASQLTSIRLFNVVSTQASTLSGRETIWPLFQDAWDASPLFGWGVGAGKVLVDPDSLVAKLLGTTTAHNEYLRVGVDGGWLGLGVLIVLFTLWAIWHTRRLRHAERTIMRLVFLAFAIHSFTDSTLIATTGCVLFAWMAAIFARGEVDRQLLPELMDPQPWPSDPASG